ncbi:glutamate racemase [Thermodesulfobacteriota bacterium]
MENNINPIGVFDSGVGGISLLQCIREELPCEDIIYIADSRYAPYGDKTREYIEKRSIAISEFLLEQKVKVIVVACNTATAAAINKMRSIYSLPIIGMEPGVKPAISITKSGTIGILATTETINSEKFRVLTERFCNDCEIITQACPGLVEKVEQISLTDNETRKMVEKYVDALTSRGVDTIVLGCTHYLFLTDVIRQVAGEDIYVIDTGKAVAKEVSRRLKEADLTTESKRKGNEYFWTSGDTGKTKKIIDQLWNKNSEVKSLPENYLMA